MNYTPITEENIEKAATLYMKPLQPAFWRVLDL